MERILSLAAQKRQFLTYCLIGVSGVTVDFGLYWFLTHFIGLHYQTANFISYSAGTLNCFWWNYHFNFKVRNNFWRRLGSFYLVGLMGWAVSLGLLHVLVEWIQLHKLLAKGISLPAVVVLQYSLNKAISFRQHPSTATA
jgi:putative flippase GtrA